MLMNDEKLKDLQECVEKLRKGCKTLVEEFEHSEECAKVFPPATDEEIEELERSLKFPLPEDYKEFLKLANGVIIDHTEICGTDRNNFTNSSLNNCPHAHDTWFKCYI